MRYLKQTLLSYKRQKAVIKLVERASGSEVSCSVHNSLLECKGLSQGFFMQNLPQNVISETLSFQSFIGGHRAAQRGGGD